MQKYNRKRLLASIFTISLIFQSVTVSAVQIDHNSSEWISSDTISFIKAKTIQECINIFRFAVVSLIGWYFFQKYMKLDSPFEPMIIANNGLSDYAGVPTEVSNTIDQFRYPEKFDGITLTRGILLLGNPGVGKTALPLAIAGEYKIPFFFVNGSDFHDKYIGEGQKRIKALFDAAKKAAKSCSGSSGKSAFSMICIDEIEALGRRDNDLQGHDAVLISKFLTEIDILNREKANVIIFATANNESRIDTAIKRTGRFSRIVISYPNEQNRGLIMTKLFESVWKGKLQKSNVTPAQLIPFTENMSHADITALFEDVARSSARATKTGPGYFVAGLWKIYRSDYEQQLPLRSKLEQMSRGYRISKDDFIKITEQMQENDIHDAVDSAGFLPAPHKIMKALNKKKEEVCRRDTAKALGMCQSLMTRRGEADACKTPEEVFSLFGVKVA